MVIFQLMSATSLLFYYVTVDAFAGFKSLNWSLCVIIQSLVPGLLGVKLVSL